MPEDAPQHPSDASPQAKVPPRQEEVGEVHLMYTIVGPQDAVPVFELSRTLEALGNVIEEGDHVLYPDRHQLVVRVRPFQEGSFLMDLVLSLQHNPTVLFFLTQPEAIARIEQVLEHLGLIKKAGEAIKTVLEVIEFLRNGKARRIEPTGRQPSTTITNRAKSCRSASRYTTWSITALSSSTFTQRWAHPYNGGLLKQSRLS